jgi:hypothetical protein
MMAIVLKGRGFSCAVSDSYRTSALAAEGILSEISDLFTAFPKML